LGRPSMAPICTTAPFANGAASVLASGARVGSGIPAAFQPRGTPGGKATYANCAPIRPQRSGASFTRSRAAPSFVWTPRKAFHGGGIVRYGWMPRTSAARRCRPRPTLPKAMKTTATHRSGTSHCCRRALECTACPNTTFDSWSSLTARDNRMVCHKGILQADASCSRSSEITGLSANQHTAATDNVPAMTLDCK
jgi:hypothetical protein